MNLPSLKDIQFATGEEILGLVSLLNQRGKLFMKVYIVLDKDGRPVEAFAYPEHAQDFISRTLVTGLTVQERTIWWSHLNPTEHDAGKSSMPQS